LIKLEKMNQEQFDKIKGKMISDYAKDKVKVGDWMEAEAVELSKDTFENIFSEGFETPEHFLFNAKNEKEEEIGYVWLNKAVNDIFVNNIYIYRDHRDKGLELELVEAIEVFSKEINASKVNLHCYGYMEDVIEVYKKLGYEITDIYFNKKI